MQILFIADPLESFKIKKDTTFAMMRELQKRGHTVVGSSRVDLQACKLEYSIVSPK